MGEIVPRDVPRIDPWPGLSALHVEKVDHIDGRGEEMNTSIIQRLQENLRDMISFKRATNRSFDLHCFVLAL
jgi:hypothetical protein